MQSPQYRFIGPSPWSSKTQKMEEVPKKLPSKSTGAPGGTTARILGRFSSFFWSWVSLERPPHSISWLNPDLLGIDHVQYTAICPNNNLNGGYGGVDNLQDVQVPHRGKPTVSCDAVDLWL